MLLPTRRVRIWIAARPMGGYHHICHGESAASATRLFISVRMDVKGKPSHRLPLSHPIVALPLGKPAAENSDLKAHSAIDLDRDSSAKSTDWQFPRGERTMRQNKSRHMAAKLNCRKHLCSNSPLFSDCIASEKARKWKGSKEKTTRDTDSKLFIFPN